MTLRIFCFYGAFGLSPGLGQLADAVKMYGEVSSHSSEDMQPINYINSLPRTGGPVKLACIGHSLGASFLQYICEHTRRWIDLGVAIDPTREWAECVEIGQLLPSMFGKCLSQLPMGPQPTQKAVCYRKLVSLHNVGAWPFGGATFIGPNVEYHTISDMHIFDVADTKVREIVEVAVKDL